MFCIRSHKPPEFCLQLFSIREVQLVSANKHLIGNVLQRVLHDQFVLISPEDTSDRFRVALRVHVCAVIIQIEIHLPDILVIHLATGRQSSAARQNDSMSKVQTLSDFFDRSDTAFSACRRNASFTFSGPTILIMPPNSKIQEKKVGLTETSASNWK